jgi:hypothetical protein
MKAQGIVNQIESTSTESLQRSLDAIEEARRACEEAGRTSEVQQLVSARAQISGHLQLVQERRSSRKRSKLTPEEIDRLVANGDPNCPKGQGWKHPSGKEVHCSGPQLVDMSWKQAKEYFEDRGYRVQVGDSAPTLKAEYGAELYTFTYASKEDPGPPRCLVMYPAPQVTWQEATARATRTPPWRLKSDTTTVQGGRGKLAFKLEEGVNKLIIRIGDCP